MRISVGMLAYNASPLIEAAIRSVYAFADEIIVVDGSAHGPSTDNTLALATGVGSKVHAVSGTFVKPNGSWDEKGQRQTYIDMMKKGSDCWCLVHDSDEIFGRPQLLLLLEKLFTASPDTMLISYPFIHFWKNIHQVRVDGPWSAPRGVGTFRLTPGVRMLTFELVGEREKEGWQLQKAPVRINCTDVFAYHYGHAMTRERILFKIRETFLAGYYTGWEGRSVEEFMTEYGNNVFDIGPDNNSRLELFTGNHPADVLPLIGTYFK